MLRKNLLSTCVGLSLLAGYPAEAQLSGSAKFPATSPHLWQSMLPF